MHQSLKQFTQLLLDNQFKVYTGQPLWQNQPTQWIYFSDGQRIGHVWYDRLVGLRFTTVHKPDSYCGTGYCIDVSPTLEGARRVLAGPPDWARVSPAPYKNLDEFLRARIKQGQELVQITQERISETVPALPNHEAHRQLPPTTAGSHHPRDL